jgi:hypothetical protein
MSKHALVIATAVVILTTAVANADPVGDMMFAEQSQQIETLREIEAKTPPLTEEQVLAFEHHKALAALGVRPAVPSDASAEWLGTLRFHRR